MSVRPSDEEPLGRPSATVNRAGRNSTRHESSDTDTNMPSSKRRRNADNQDEAEYPSKRIRLRRSSTRSLRVVSFRFVTFLALSLSSQARSNSLIIAEVASRDPLQLRGPVASQSEGVQVQTIEPTDKGPTASTSEIDWSTPERLTAVELDHPSTVNTSKVVQTVTSQKKVMRTGSSSSISSKLASTSVCSPVRPGTNADYV